MSTFNNGVVGQNNIEGLLRSIWTSVNLTNNGRISCGAQSLVLTGSATPIIKLTPPASAQSCVMTLEKNSSTSGVAARYDDGGTLPLTPGVAGTGVGVPMIDLAIHTIYNLQTMATFQIISNDSSHDQYLTVEYYR